MKIKKMIQSDLISQLGLEKLSEKNRQIIVEDISKTMMQKIIVRLLEELPEEKVKEFKDKIGEKNRGDIELFLDANLPGYEKYISQEIVSYRKQLMVFVKKALRKE